MKNNRYSESHKRARIVRSMGKQGIDFRTIAKKLNLSTVTVQRQLAGDICNPDKERPIRPKYIASDRKALTIKLYRQCGFTLRQISDLMKINYCYVWHLSHKTVNESDYKDNPVTIKATFKHGPVTIRKVNDKYVEVIETKSMHTKDEIKWLIL